jgi:hypothetical protein
MFDQLLGLGSSFSDSYTAWSKKKENDTGKGSIELGTANEHYGTWKDGDGDEVHGVHRDLAAYKQQLELGDQNSREVGAYFGVESSLADASLDASYDEGGTIGAGLQANAASAALYGGTTGTKHDEHVRVGLSIGEGAAGRVHFGDRDDDGRNEYGFGFDAGPVSMDLKTEDPVRKAVQMATLGLVGTDYDPDRANWTDAVYGEDTQGTRGGAQTFGEMNALEQTMHAVFNPGMNDEARSRILGERMQGVSALFGGQY